MMRITVSGRHMDVSDALKSYANDKAGKLQRYYDRVQSVEIVFDRRADSHLSEVIARADHHTTFVAKEEHEDPYVAVDAALKELERQLRRHKERFRNRKHPEGLMEREPLADVAPENPSRSSNEGEAT